ncbi:MAG: class I SAM-dependent methyltransferase [Candidatus Yanofskybacteria bacterium]|nr:class I SAM-dependent methyltransferase [Candidatus Yanofskybacteria bacterium]
MKPDFYKQYFQIEKDHWLMRVRRLIIFDLLKKYAKLPDGKVKILDFGCGSGYLVGELAKLGYNSFGVDNFDEAIEYGKQRGIKNLSVVFGAETDYESSFFDVVFALDVLEHLENEEPVLREIERILRPGGVLIIMAPAFMFLWGVQDEVAHHYRRYTMPKLLETIRKSSNLSVVQKTYFNAFLFMPIALVRLFSRWFNIKNRESDFDINNPVLNKIFFWIINLERFLLRHLQFPFGVSILTVLKKIDDVN